MDNFRIMEVRIKTQRGEIVRILDVIDYFCLMLKLQHLAQKELLFESPDAYYTIEGELVHGKLFADGVEWE